VVVPPPLLLPFLRNWLIALLLSAIVAHAWQPRVLLK